MFCTTSSATSLGNRYARTTCQSTGVMRRTSSSRATASPAVHRSNADAAWPQTSPGRSVAAPPIVTRASEMILEGKVTPMMSAEVGA